LAFGLIFFFSLKKKKEFIQMIVFGKDFSILPYTE